MSNYQFVRDNGKIETRDYKSSALNVNQVKDELKRAFEALGADIEVEILSDDYNNIYLATLGERKIYICAKGTTPGGRSQLKNEQRIQPKAKFINFIHEKYSSDEEAVLLGIYKEYNNVVICAWKQVRSDAGSPETPISKQIKIETIAQAMSEGFVQQVRSGTELVCAFRKEFLYFYLNNSSWLHTGNVTNLASETQPLNYEEDIDSNGYLMESIGKYASRINYNTEIETEYPRNLIVFGAPGTGKSYKLKKQCDEYTVSTGGSYERITFHPEYTYSHFVGSYKPVTNFETNEISYSFVPGPFVRLLVKAIKNTREDTKKPFILLIEEINRAKVAAVFGEVFQLLDRDNGGVSEYSIQASEDLKGYLVKELGGTLEDYNSLMIPNNMFIWATMNSADQGVYPMDTAFKRRWEFDYIGIDQYENKNPMMIELGKDSNRKNIDWRIFRKAINEKLVEDYKINEDKLLGPYFLSSDVIEVNSEDDPTIANKNRFINAFKSKVIMYLFEDAGKQHKHKLFDGCNGLAGFTTTKYSSICKAFDILGIKLFGDDFEDIYDNLKES